MIIPNKAFVTERLINWSLTDTTTRLVIRLGVAYGSDLEKVRKVLLKAATEHPRVMHEPMPEVFFTAFGAARWIMSCVCMCVNCVTVVVLSMS